MLDVEFLGRDEFFPLPFHPLDFALNWFNAIFQLRESLLRLSMCKGGVSSTTRAFAKTIIGN